MKKGKLEIAVLLKTMGEDTHIADDEEGYVRILEDDDEDDVDLDVHVEMESEKIGECGSNRGREISLSSSVSSSESSLSSSSTIIWDHSCDDAADMNDDGDHHDGSEIYPQQDSAKKPLSMFIPDISSTPSSSGVKSLYPPSSNLKDSSPQSHENSINCMENNQIKPIFSACGLWILQFIIQILFLGIVSLIGFSKSQSSSSSPSSSSSSSSSLKGNSTSNVVEPSQQQSNGSFALPYLISSLIVAGIVIACAGFLARICYRKGKNESLVLPLVSSVGDVVGTMVLILAMTFL